MKMKSDLVKRQHILTGKNQIYATQHLALFCSLFHVMISPRLKKTESFVDDQNSLKVVSFTKNEGLCLWLCLSFMWPATQKTEGKGN